jgi:hypothetical protein
MSTHNAGAFYHFTISRRNTPPHAPPRVVVQVSPISVTAPSEWRVSADVRQLCERLIERFPVLVSVEALCRFDVEPSPIPGLVLWDRGFGLWMAVFDDAICLSIGTELLDGNPIERVRAAQEYVEFLSEAGYDTLFDHQDGRLHAEGTHASSLAERIAAGGYSRWFRRMVRGCGLGLFFGSATGFLAPIIVRAGPHGAANARWTDFVLAVAIGSIAAGLQYWVTRKGLKQEVQQMRSAILKGPGHEARLVFHESAVLLAVVVLGTLLFGGFASMAFASDRWLIGLYLAAFCACSVVSVATSWGRVLSLDDHSIQSQAHLDRTRRIAYEDVIRIVRWPSLYATVVSSERDWLVVPDTFDLRGQLVGLLWDRVLALKSPPAEQAASGAETLQQLRASLGAARREGFRLRDARRTPLWMIVRRSDHPLRPQYACHRQLLREGRVVLGRVLTANQTLFGRPRTPFDAPAIAIYGADEDTSFECLDRIAARLSDSSDREAAEWFQEAHAAHRGFPLQLPLPQFLAGDRQVYCTSVMVVRRQIPLGTLRAPWLPLLVTPSLPFTMVMPMRLWGSGIRDRWKRGRGAG